jgi:hypothetical protein
MSTHSPRHRAARPTCGTGEAAAFVGSLSLLAVLIAGAYLARIVA